MSGDLSESTLALVRGEARRIAGLLPSGAVEFEDLVGYGHLGLIEARERFDPRRAVNFEVYARHRIRGAIYDGIRQSIGPLKLRTYERLKRQIVAWRLAGEPPPAPTSDAARAAAAEVTWNAIADLATALLAARAEQRPSPPDPERLLLEAERLEAVRDAVDRLEPDERELVRAVYDMDEVGDSAAELARRRGIHRSGITRRHRAALDRLRRWLKVRPP